MIIKNESHLTYCTNIHPGETWDEIFKSLKEYILPVKKKLNTTTPFGIGLRLSQKSTAALLQANNLLEFKTWLDQNRLYVFTLNGFPYGDFHNTIIKDKVHKPDWTTTARLNYTSDLIKILTYLLPENTEGGISTSPLSYKYWFSSQEDINKAKQKACIALTKIVLQLIKVKKTTNKILHIDLEPEPDGFLENTQEVLDFYNHYLLKEGVSIIKTELNCSANQAKTYVLNHIQICYDVCHFALAYEKPEYVINSFEAVGIKIGKIQISAAISCKKATSSSIKSQQLCLQQFVESTYLHQSVVKLKDNSLLHFRDLEEGIALMKHPDFKEIRTHFHVPIFISNFQILESTQKDIIEALLLWKEKKYSKHLEVETYTWAVLPEHLQIDITNSIVRELKWVKDQLSY